MQQSNLKDLLTTGKSEFPAYVGITAVKKDQVAKDNRIYHILTVTDSIFSCSIFVWTPTTSHERGQYLLLPTNLEVVKGDKPFFSSKNDLTVVEYALLPKESPVKSIIFKFNNDVYKIQQFIREFVDLNVPDPNFTKLIYQLTELSMLNLITKAPAAKGMHHAIEGGLLKHIDEMMRIYVALALSTCEHFEDMRHELVVIGIILHDFFKVKDYKETEDGAYEMTEDGVLLGHLYSGAQFLQKQFLVCEQANDIKFSNRDKMLAVHTLLAHHGQLDFGSPVVPSIKEAIVLHYIDQISAKCNMWQFGNHMEYNRGLGTSVIK